MNGYSRPTERSVPSDFPKGLLLRAVPAIASHAYSKRDDFELNLQLHQRLHIIEAKGEWWYVARTMDGTEGWVPSSYIKLLESPQALDMRKTFHTWTTKLNEAFRAPAKGEKKDKLTRLTFPWLPPEVCACELPSCWLRKQDRPLGACIHDVEVLLKGAGDKYEASWLWKMSLGWHPDRFVKKFKESFKEEGMLAVGEMFGILTEMANKEREEESEAKMEKVV